MPRNVEIKAYLQNFEATFQRAKGICPGFDPVILKQHDTFFNSPTGRLKLREFGVTHVPAELIFYNRPDVEGPKVSAFVKTEVLDPNGTKEILKLSMGIKGELKKERYLFLHDQTRIHLDRVEGLGDFMELEVCLREHQDPEDGNEIANNLMQLLGIPSSDLLKGAYIDQLLAR